MDISRAALPPRQPAVTEAQRRHPLFPQYQSYRSAMSARLVEADSFDAWLLQRERARRDEELEQHPRYGDFQRWMRETRGGTPGRTTLVWPENFRAWLNGERW